MVDCQPLPRTSPGHPRRPAAAAGVHPSSSFLTVEGCVENKNGAKKRESQQQQGKKLHSFRRQPPFQGPAAAAAGRPSFIISDWHPVFMFA